MLFFDPLADLAGQKCGIAQEGLSASAKGLQTGP
jgi:hypothetical protein